MAVVIIRNQGRERKGLNTICQFLLVSLLELGLGVTDAQLPESEDVSLSIIVTVLVRVTITQFPRSEDREIYLGGDGEFNE